MRVIVAAPPKTGNVWIENILSHIYGLDILSSVPEFDYWEKRSIDGLRQFVQNGQFRKCSIFHQHFWPTEEFLTYAAEIPCHLVTTIRNPYDEFVSLYFYIQNFADTFIAAKDPGMVVISKPIDHPDVLGFLEDRFGAYLVQANEWLECGKSIVVRYEDLHLDQFTVIRRVTHQIAPVDRALISDAIVASGAAKMREKDHWMEKHIRSAIVGDWKNHLSEAHLKVFRSCHARLISTLGYQIL